MLHEVSSNILWNPSFATDDSLRCYLDQTLPSIVAKKKQKAAIEEQSESVSETPTAAASESSSPASAASTVEGSAAEQEPSPKKKSDFWILIKNRQIQALLFGGFIFHFLGVAFDVVFVLFSYTKIKLGGMERSVSQSFIPLDGNRTHLFDIYAFFE